MLGPQHLNKQQKKLIKTGDFVILKKEKNHIHWAHPAYPRLAWTQTLGNAKADKHTKALANLVAQVGRLIN